MKMKHLNNFNQYISESMKTVNDLNSNVGLFIYDDSITLYDPKTDKVYGYIGLSQNKNGIYYFPSVAAESGYGPLIFEMALMYVYINNEYLMVSRDGDIRGAAFNVWEKFYNRTDVLKEVLDFDDEFYNFAIITGEEDFDGEISKMSEYEFHIEDGHEKDITVYNTKMRMRPSDEFYSLQNKYSGLDLSLISDKGRDFFSYRYED